MDWKRYFSKKVLERGYDLFYNNLNLVLNILSEVNTNE